MNRDEVIDTLKEEWQKFISWCPEITAEFEDDIVQTVVQSDSSLILTHEDLNKLLLCRDQNIVGKSFFEYFFEGELVRTIGQLQKGVEKFRVKALLLYGNFQYAFRSFRQRPFRRESECRNPQNEPHHLLKFLLRNQILAASTNITTTPTTDNAATTHNSILISLPSSLRMER